MSNQKRNQRFNLGARLKNFVSRNSNPQPPIGQIFISCISFPFSSILQIIGTLPRIPVFRGNIKWNHQSANAKQIANWQLWVVGGVARWKLLLKCINQNLLRCFVSFFPILCVFWGSSLPCERKTLPNNAMPEERNINLFAEGGFTSICPILPSGCGTSNMFALLSGNPRGIHNFVYFMLWNGIWPKIRATRRAIKIYGWMKPTCYPDPLSFMS